MNRTLALQCHIEVTANMIDEWIKYYPDDISNPDKSVQNAELMLAEVETRCARLNSVADVFYRYWLHNGALL